MPERSSTASAASRHSTADCSNKRVKIEQFDNEPLSSAPGSVEGSNPESDAENNAEVDAEDDAEDCTVSFVRDSEYYFEDGSVTFRVDGILFKVHTSLLKAHSTDLLNKLQPSSSGSSTPSGGTCDHDAIVIPDVQSSQFRNLLKIIYCLPSNSIVFTQASPTAYQVVGDFDCYLDVAIISRKFDMETMHQWAKKKLSQLVYNSGKTLAEDIDDFYDDCSSDNGDDNHLGNDCSRSSEEVGNLGPADSYNAYRFVEAIQYARAVSDNNLLYDMLTVLEYYCAWPTLHVGFLISFFRITDLRKTNPSLFGFFFLLFLSRGNQVWIEHWFTQEDRLALFSAQSFLTPLPESLKESILAPLFTRPTCADLFTAIFSAGCKSGCQQENFDHWEQIFPADYYDSIADKEFSVSIKALTTLPLRRLDFSAQLRRVQCQRCRQRTLEQLDQDIQEVFILLAEYYKVYG